MAAIITKVLGHKAWFCSISHSSKSQYWLQRNISSEKQVLPKVIWEKCIATLTAENALTRFVHVLLATQCPLQMSPISRLWVFYIHTTVPHASYKLHCTGSNQPFATVY